MRRRVGAVAGVVGLVVAIAIPVSAAATKPRAYHLTLLGAQISGQGTSSFQAAYKVTSSADGSGAAVQVGKTTGTKFPLSGTSSDSAYFADGVSKSKDTFKIATPNAASGISVVTGTGKCVGGTGVHKHEKCSYKLVGTINTKTNVSKVTVTGKTTR